MKKTFILSCLLILFGLYTNCSKYQSSDNADSPTAAGGGDASGGGNQTLAMVPAPVPASPTCRGGQFYIDPTVATTGSGTQASPWKSWPAVNTLIAGACYYQKGGTTFDLPSGALIQLNGAAGNWTSFGSYGAGMATLRGWLVFSGASYVQVNGLNFIPSPNTPSGAAPVAAISLMNGSHHVQILNNKIALLGLGGNIVMGIWFGSSTAPDHSLVDNLVMGNQITGAQTSGISVATEVHATLGHENYITGNSISYSACHGIDVSGDYYILERNQTFQNGQSVGGCSGIHTYAGGQNGSASFEGGSHLIIRYNISYNNKDTSTDGNGLQLDQFTHDNQVLQNLLFNNDGTGVNLWDSSSNLIAGNVLFGNCRDTGAVHMAYHGELLLGSASGGAGHFTTGNTIQGNEVIATQNSAVAVFVDGFSAAGNQTFAKNWFASTQSASAPVFNWNATVGTAISQWNSLAHATDAFSGLPFCTTSASPLFNFGSLAAAFHIEGRSVTTVSWDPIAGLCAQ